MSIETDQNDKDLQAQYNAAFNEDQPAPAEQSDDDAFGIAPPEEAVAAAEAAEPAGDDGAAGESAETAAAATPAVSDDDQNVSAATEEVDDPKEVQRLKSWEGRLKKLEAELKAKAPVAESAAVEALEETSEQAEGVGNDALSEAAEKVADQVEDGTLTVDQAMKQLTEDFGEDFVKMIEAIASAKAGEVGGKAATAIKGEVDSIVSHIADADERAHFAKIAQAFPDFNDVRQSPDFQAFAQSTPALQQAAKGGSADEVIKLIKDFKASQAPAAAAATPPAPAPEAVKAGQADPEGADAAAGVRSGGLRLPATPADASDYASAWEEAANSR